MSTHQSYIPSTLAGGDSEILRHHSFTRWMSRDLLQATTDFCRNIGLIALYAETSSDGLSRYIFWKPPQGSYFEIRSGRTLQQFEEFDRKNLEKGWKLLSLHVSEKDIYSAVWISAEQFPIAIAVLQNYGITPARRQVV